MIMSVIIRRKPPAPGLRESARLASFDGASMLCREGTPEDRTGTYHGAVLRYDIDAEISSHVALRDDD